MSSSNATKAEASKADILLTMTPHEAAGLKAGDLGSLNSGGTGSSRAVSSTTVKHGECHVIQRSRLMALPAELRLLILGYLLEPNNDCCPEVTPATQCPVFHATPMKHPAIFRVCRQLHHEASYLRGKEDHIEHVHLDHLTPLAAMNLDKGRRHAIKHLHIHVYLGNDNVPDTSSLDTDQRKQAVADKAKALTTWVCGLEPAVKSDKRWEQRNLETLTLSWVRPKQIDHISAIDMVVLVEFWRMRPRTVEVDTFYYYHTEDMIGITDFNTKKSSFTSHVKMSLSLYRDVMRAVEAPIYEDREKALKEAVDKVLGHDWI